MAYKITLFYDIKLKKPKHGSFMITCGPAVCASHTFGPSLPYLSIVLRY